MLSIIILAAGKGKRMISSKPKVLIDLAGKKMIDYPIALAIKLKADKIIVVLGSQYEMIETYLKKYKLDIVYQKDQLGTADAVKKALPKIDSKSDRVLILSGDMPLIELDDIKEFIKSAKADINFITTKLSDPAGYGRVVRGSKSEIIRVVEEKDANTNEKNISEINTGIYLCKLTKLKELIKSVKPTNAQKEYYLTDIISNKSYAHLSTQSENFLGVNDRVQLEVATKLLWSKRVKSHMLAGVSIYDKNTCYLDDDITIGKDTVIYPNVYIMSGSKIGTDCVISSNSIIENSTIKNSVTIQAGSIIESATIGSNSIIGPMAHIRPDTILHGNNKIGNFVELKNSEMGIGSQASHLSYLGDALLGENVNIGCGTITCNYDGANKHRTIIGNGVFVGSDVQFIAPVTIGDNSVIAAGSTITEDVSSSDLAISRTRQINIKNKGSLIIERNKKQKKRNKN